MKNGKRFIYSLFLRLRGDVGMDLSRGRLSDRIREVAIGLIGVRPGKTILEVGVGEGLLSCELIDRGFAEKVVGVDVSRGKLKEARGRFVGRDSVFVPIISLGDMLPIAQVSFERVICINTLHNQPSWEEVKPIVRAMCDVVGSNGSIVFDIRNGRDPLISTIYKFAPTLDPSTKSLPVRAYPLSRVKRLLRGYGFKIEKSVRVRYPFWFLPSAYVIEAKK